VSFLFEFNRGKAMKKILLTTTALSIVAGVASAEITFSGSGEAGVYRLAPTAATTGTAAIEMEITATADTNTTDEGIFTYSSGLLTYTAATGTAGTTASQILAEVDKARDALAAAIGDYEQDLETANGLDNATNGDTEIERNNALDDATAHLAEIKRLEATIAKMTAVAATGKGATPKLKAYSGYDFNVAASGASDNGMTFAMGFDMGAGHIADQDDDRAMDAQAGAIDTSGLTIGYAGYTVVIGDEKVDDLYDADGWNADVSLSGSLGDLTFTLATDMDDDVKAVAGGWVFTEETDGGTANRASDSTYVPSSLVYRDAVAAEYNPTSYAIGYTMGDVAFSMAGTEHDARGNAAAKMSLTYTLSDALSATLSSDNVGTYKDIAKVSVTSKISDAISITASVKDDKDHALNTNTGGKQSQDVSIAYSAGALSSTLATDEGSNWWVNAKYDLGGGATAFTTFDHTEFLVAGVNFKF